MPEIFKKNIKRATDNIINYGDTDVFPYPFENILIRRNPSGFVDEIESLSNNFDEFYTQYPPQFESTLVPVGYTGFRWATQICPFWNAYLLSAILRYSKEIEEVRIPSEQERVHSYRLNSGDNARLFQSGFNWTSFMKKSYEQAQNSSYVVITDISEFYRRVYHHRTENALEQIIPSSIPDKIIKLLSRHSNQTSYGLPIGGPAARIISEITINQIDHLLLSKGVNFLRFSDDYHLFVGSIPEAHEALQQLSEYLIINQGLTLQKSKTRIVSSNEFLRTFPKHLNPEADTDSSDRGRLFSLSLSYDPYSKNADEDYDKLKTELDSIDFLSLLNEELNKSQVHGPTMQRLIKAIRVLSPFARNKALSTLFENAELLYPMTSNILIMINQIFNDLSTDEKVKVRDHIYDLIESGSYIFRLDIHKSFAVRILSNFNHPKTQQILGKWYDEGVPFLRRDIITALIKLHDWYKLSDIKNYSHRASQWEYRAFICASYSLGDEGKYWREAQAFHSIDKFVAKEAAALKQSNELGVLG